MNPWKLLSAIKLQRRVITNLAAWRAAPACRAVDGDIDAAFEVFGFRRIDILLRRNTIDRVLVLSPGSTLFGALVLRGDPVSPAPKARSSSSPRPARQRRAESKSAVESWSRRPQPALVHNPAPADRAIASQAGIEFSCG
jgi:hypothetical protein